MLDTASSTQIKKHVHVKGYARLHMGFFDLNGSIGRRFGSIGVAIEAYTTEMKFRMAEQQQLDVKNTIRVTQLIDTFVQALNINQKFSISSQSEIPEHAGLGSGTQMALVIGMGISELFKLNLSPRKIAELTQRGMRSGIGIGTFESGGVVVDGGIGTLGIGSVPPVIAHVKFPDDWRIVLITDGAYVGAHGEQEVNAFRALPKATLASAEQLSHRVLMQALPALAEQDLTTFGAAVRALQMATGDYFAPIQGGRYASSQVAEVLSFVEKQGFVCYGQSSWGPTGFVIVESESIANALVNNLKANFLHFLSISFLVTKAHNEGSFVD